MGTSDARHRSASAVPQQGSGGKLLPRATPASIDHVRQNAPAELLALPNWVCGDRRPKPGKDKSGKVPINPHTGYNGKTNDPTTWGTFEEAAVCALRLDHAFGVGVNLLGTEFLGLDLDHVIDTTTREICFEATRLTEAIQATYTEISPSGDGLRIFFRGKMPAGYGGKQFDDVFGKGTKLEVYDGSSGSRYLTVTGRVLGDRHPIATATAEDLEAIAECAKPMPKQAPAPLPKSPVAREPVPLDDHQYDVERAQFVLDNVLAGPDDGTEADWFRVVGALASLGHEGRALALTWSQRGSKYNPVTDCTDRHFARYNGKLRIGSLFKMADDQRPGWRDLPGAPRKRRRTSSGGQSSGTQDPDSYKLGQRDEATGKLVLSQRRTWPTAEAFLREHHAHADGRTLHDHGGQLWKWQDNHYVPIEDEGMRARLHPWLHDAVRVVENRDTKKLELIPFDANPTSVASALATVRSMVHLPIATPVPAWIGPGDAPAPVHELMPCRSATLHIPSGDTLLPTPALFAFNALDFDYDPAAPEPVRWYAFLRDLFGDDHESIDLLQQWFGYSLTNDTRQQKALLIVGPRRSGKGTIARVLARLVGLVNVTGPTTSGLAGNFGLQPLIGKSLAIVSDARFRGENVSTAVERLLCIIGEDSLTIDRKHRESLTMKLPVRFVVLSNELPRFDDSSAALAGRFLTLKLTKSFYGHEDVGLTEALLQDLPGILLWALHGWHRLHDRGRFTEPESSRQAVQDIEDMSSPVGAFVREQCILGPGHEVTVHDLYAAWQRWCAADGRTICSTKQSFGRDLAAAVPQLVTRRGTGMVRRYVGIGLQGWGAAT